MMWFFAVLIVLAMGGIALVASGRGAPLAEVYDDRPDATVPATGQLAAEDLRRVRFSIALRGYRMSEVDALLDRLAGQLETPLGPPEHPVEHRVEQPVELPADGRAEREARGDGRTP
jgi:DivIVA domain-containing protein